MDPMVWQNTDVYFTRSREILDRRDSDPLVRYAVFTRYPGAAALRPAISFVKKECPEAQVYALSEGTRYNAKSPLIVIEGRLQELVELETQILQLVGLPCSACRVAQDIVAEANGCEIIDMHARHDVFGGWPTLLVGYAARVAGIKLASTTAGSAAGYAPIGTIPHVLVGAAGGTLESARWWADRYPGSNLIILPDFYGREISDTLEVLKEFGKDLWGVRLDTPGERWAEATRSEESTETVRLRLEAFSGSKPDYTRVSSQYIHGPGVTVESYWQARLALDANGGQHVKIILSSGFGPDKCRLFREFGCLDPERTLIGTGSFLPKDFTSAIATMDCYQYDGSVRVKVGREWLATTAEDGIQSGSLRKDPSIDHNSWDAFVSILKP